MTVADPPALDTAATALVPSPADALLALVDPAPAPGAFHVPRPALVHRLLSAREARVALLVAPPGYGKSSLLAEWADRDERPFVWLTPHESLNGLAEVIRTLRPPFVAVIDLDERGEPALLGQMVDRALAALPAGGTIALASRTEPPIALGRLRAQRLLVEVRTSDLRMNAAEAALLLEQEGLTPTPEEAEALAAATEGWPAVLLMAALAAHAAPSDPLRFDGTHHLIGDYVRDEVLTPLDPELRRFAVHTSVLHRLSGRACDTVLGEPGTARTLERLAALTPLLIPVDAAHHSYRWHAVMRDALLAELRRTAPEMEPELHGRACRWHRRRGDVEHAIGHAATAGDAQLVAELLGPYAVEPLTRGRHRRLHAWLDALGGGVVADHSALALYASFTALSAGDAFNARRWAQTGLARCDRGSGAALVKQLRLAEAVAGSAHVGPLGDAAAAAASSLGPKSRWQPYCHLVRAVSLHLTGDANAAAALLDAGTSSIDDQAPMVTALALAQRAMIALQSENWATAAEATDDARDTVSRCELEREPVAALVFAASAASRAHQGRADEAKADVRRSVDLLTRLGDFVPWYGAESRILLGHAALWLADVTRARALLAEASRLARRVPDAVAFAGWFDAAWAHMDTLAETSLSGPSALTIAELRVLRFLPSHRSFREIGAQLNVSGNTVKTQAHAVYRKLGVASRSEAVDRAVDAGLLGR